MNRCYKSRGKKLKIILLTLWSKAIPVIKLLQTKLFQFKIFPLLLKFFPQLQHLIDVYFTYKYAFSQDAFQFLLHTLRRFDFDHYISPFLTSTAGCNNNYTLLLCLKYKYMFVYTYICRSLITTGFQRIHQTIIALSMPTK